MVPAPGPAFIGRSEELRVLADVIDSLHRGRGALVWVEGDAGIGKTTFCDEVALRAESACRVGWVTCGEMQALPAFWPWNHLLRQLELPSLITADPFADSRVARVALFDTVLDALRGSGRERPLLLVIDDAQWMDPPSLELLRFLSPQLRRSPVVILVATRRGEPTAGLAHEQVHDAFASHSLRVDLGGLGLSDLRSIVTSLAGSEPTREGLADLLRRADGNPLFARELALSADDSLAVPASITAAFGRRLGHLSPACRDLLDAVAIIGDAAAITFAGQVLDSGPQPVLVALEEAVSAQLAIVSPTAEVSLIHPLLRDSLLGSLGVARRVRWHERVAEALVAWRDAGHPVDVSALAAHFSAAVAAGRGHEAVTYCVAAAEDAIARLAYESAADQYGAALAALDLAPEAADRGDLLLRRGEALVACGSPGLARAAFAEAAEFGRATGDVGLLARSALAVAGGDGFEVDLLDDLQKGLLAEALSRVGSTNEPLRARLVARLTIANSLVESGTVRLRDADDALALARRIGDADALLDSLAAVCDASAGPDDAELREDLSTEMLAIAQTRGDIRKELLARRLRLEARLETGDVGAFDRDVHDFAVDAHRLRQPLFSWYVPLWRATRCWMNGEDDAAARFLDQAEALGREAGSHNAGLLVLTSRTMAALDRDSAPEDIDDALMAGDVSGLEPWMVITRAYAGCAVRTFAGTRDELDNVIRCVVRLPQDSEYVPALVQATGVAVACADATLAETLYPVLLPHRARNAVEGIGAYCHGSVERHLGSLAALMGDQPSSRQHFAAAHAANRAMGAAFLSELTDRDERHASPVSARTSRALMRGVFRRSGDHWTVGLDGDTVTVVDSKGVRDIARLLARPGQGIPALDMATSASARGSSQSTHDAGPPGDLGEVVDARGRAAYRQRLIDLDEEIADADAAADLARGERARVERDFLVEELTAAYGIGGRARRLGDPAERARTTVTARIRDALGRLEAAAPNLGAHLRRSIRTGRICTYDPEAAVRWEL